MPGRSTVRGYIEKKKDWLERARDYQSKEKQLRHLKRKAKDRNPDEFNYHMIRSQVRLDGVHQDLADKPEEESEVQKLLSDVRDLEYVTHKYSLEQKKIEKLKGILHKAGSTKNKSTRTVFVDTKEEAEKTKEKILENLSTDGLSTSDADIDALTRQQYAELELRQKRAKELRTAKEKLELKKNLQMSRGQQLKPRLMTKRGVKQYKWTFERKK